VLALLLSACAGPNRVPSAPVIDIEPAMPHTSDDLQLVMLEPAVDGDGDFLVYSNLWYQDGRVRMGATGRTLPAVRTTAGEYWIAEVWANDGALDGPVAAATVYIFNTAPEAEVRLLPPEPSSAVDLVAAVEVQDLDGHEVELEYSWWVDGEPVDLSGYTVPAEWTSGGQTWTVEVAPYDGDSWGVPAEASVAVGD